VVIGLGPMPAHDVDVVQIYHTNGVRVDKGHKQVHDTAASLKTRRGQVLQVCQLVMLRQSGAMH